MENCNHCGAGRPPRNEPSPTKAYESFEDFLARVTLNDEQVDCGYREAVAVLKQAYEAGHDLDNYDVDEAIALDTVAMYNRLEFAYNLVDRLAAELVDERYEDDDADAEQALYESNLDAIDRLMEYEPYEDVYLGRNVTIHLEPGETITVVGSDGDTMVIDDALR